MITYAVRQSNRHKQKHSNEYAESVVRVICHATKCQSHGRSWSWSTTIDIPWWEWQLQKHASSAILISVSIGRRSWCRCRLHVCTNFCRIPLYYFRFRIRLWPLAISKIKLFSCALHIRTHTHTPPDTHMQLKIIENSIPFPVLFTRITRCTFHRLFSFHSLSHSTFKFSIESQ